MDADRFDTLLRSLSQTPTRRGALRVLAGSLFGSLVTLSARDAAAHNALKKCKKKSGKQKKACLKRAGAHNAQHVADTPSPCVPDCRGRECGPDDCSGSCGTCPGDSFCSAGGICVCPAGMELCGGACRSLCPVGQTHDPDSCGCCQTGGGEVCDPNNPNTAPCCGRCDEGICFALLEGVACRFNAQCATTICRDGVCRCPSGQEACDGFCYDPCPSSQLRDVGSLCRCCITNGATCNGTTATCCAGTNRCTGAGSTTCVGREDDDPCTFDAQCASRFGCNGGQCGGVIGS